MARALNIAVSAADEGRRLDAFLAENGAYPSRSASVKAIEASHVFVNGMPKAKNYVLSANDTVVYEEMPQVERPPIVGQDIPLDVRYEDEWLMVLSKQAYLCVHPSPGHYESTLVHALVNRYGRENLAHVQGDDRPGIVHRLDLETSGLMLCAKTDEAGNRLQDMIRLRVVDRKYLCMVHGNIAHNTGLIDEPVARGYADRLRMVVSDRAGSRQAITSFSVLERFEAGFDDNGYTLLECKLYTGRTHQIRVHMEFIGHCCVGDPLYKWGPPQAQLGLVNRQFLHSYHLGFEHPFTGKEMVFTDALPPDLQSAHAIASDRLRERTEEGEAVAEVLSHSPSQPVGIQIPSGGSLQ